MVQKFFLKVSCMSKLICFHNHHHRIGIIRQAFKRSQCSDEDCLFHFICFILFYRLFKIYYQKIEDVVKSRELREHIGKMNKKVFEQMYSLKIMKEKYLYLFEDL